MTEERGSFQTGSAFMVRTGMSRERDSASRTEG
jgi:hypothetical protein